MLKTSAVLIYFALGTALAFYSRRARGRGEFFLMRQNPLCWFFMMLSYGATTYSSFMMIGLVGLAAATGQGALYFEGIYLLTTVGFLWFLGDRIRRCAKACGAVSAADLVVASFGRRIGMLTTLISLMALLPYTASQITGAALLLQNAFGDHLPFAVAASIIAFFIGFWVVVGGIRSVVLTDAVAAAFMLGLVVAVAWWFGRLVGGRAGFGVFPNAFWTPSNFINMSLPWAFFALTNPQVLSRLFLLKDRRDLRKMTVSFAFFGLVFTLATCFIGFFMRTAIGEGMLKPADGSALTALLGAVPPLAGLLWILGVLAASVTTANSILLSLAAMVERTFLPQTPTGGLAEIVRWGGLWLFCAAAATLSISHPPFIVALALLSAKILLVLLPLYGASFWAKGSEKAGMLSLTGGLVVLLIARLHPFPLDSLVLIFVGSVGLAAGMIKKTPKET